MSRSLIWKCVKNVNLWKLILTYRQVLIRFLGRPRDLIRQCWTNQDSLQSYNKKIYQPSNVIFTSAFVYQPSKVIFTSASVNITLEGWKVLMSTSMKLITVLLYDINSLLIIRRRRRTLFQQENIFRMNASLTYGPQHSRQVLEYWTSITYVQTRWGLRTPSMLRAGYATLLRLLTWRKKYGLSRLKTNRCHTYSENSNWVFLSRSMLIKMYHIFSSFIYDMFSVVYITLH